MSGETEGLRMRPHHYSKDGRYLVFLIDNSESVRQTKIGDKTLFELQLLEVNRTIDALRAGKAALRTEVLVVCFDGAVGKGWTRVLEHEDLTVEQFKFCNCTPLLDFLAAVLDHLESIYREACAAMVNVRCGFMLTTDGLEGVTMEHLSFPVSVTSEQDVRTRMDWFNESGFSANALAIGEDGGLSVKDFLERIGLKDHSIRASGLAPSALRRAFGDVSVSTIKGLGFP